MMNSNDAQWTPEEEYRFQHHILDWIGNDAIAASIRDSLGIYQDIDHTIDLLSSNEDLINALKNQKGTFNIKNKEELEIIKNHMSTIPAFILSIDKQHLYRIGRSEFSMQYVRQDFYGTVNYVHRKDHSLVPDFYSDHIHNAIDRSNDALWDTIFSDIFDDDDELSNGILELDDTIDGLVRQGDTCKGLKGDAEDEPTTNHIVIGGEKSKDNDPLVLGIDINTNDGVVHQGGTGGRLPRDVKNISDDLSVDNVGEKDDFNSMEVNTATTVTTAVDDIMTKSDDTDLVFLYKNIRSSNKKIRRSISQHLMGTSRNYQGASQIATPYAIIIQKNIRHFLSSLRIAKMKHTPRITPVRIDIQHPTCTTCITDEQVEGAVIAMLILRRRHEKRTCSIPYHTVHDWQLIDLLVRASNDKIGNELLWYWKFVCFHHSLLLTVTGQYQHAHIAFTHLPVRTSTFTDVDWGPIERARGATIKMCITGEINVCDWVIFASKIVYNLSRSWNNNMPRPPPVRADVLQCLVINKLDTAQLHTRITGLRDVPHSACELGAYAIVVLIHKLVVVFVWTLDDLLYRKYDFTASNTDHLTEYVYQSCCNWYPPIPERHAYCGVIKSLKLILLPNLLPNLPSQLPSPSTSSGPHDIPSTTHRVMTFRTDDGEIVDDEPTELAKLMYGWGVNMMYGWGVNIQDVDEEPTELTKLMLMCLVCPCKVYNNGQQILLFRERETFTINWLSCSCASANEDNTAAENGEQTHAICIHPSKRATITISVGNDIIIMNIGGTDDADMMLGFSGSEATDLMLDFSDSDVILNFLEVKIIARTYRTCPHFAVERDTFGHGEQSHEIIGLDVSTTGCFTHGECLNICALYLTAYHINTIYGIINNTLVNDNNNYDILRMRPYVAYDLRSGKHHESIKNTSAATFELICAVNWYVLEHEGLHCERTQSAQRICVNIKDNNDEMVTPNDSFGTVDVICTSNGLCVGYRHQQRESPKNVQSVLIDNATTISNTITDQLLLVPTNLISYGSTDVIIYTYVAAENNIKMYDISTRLKYNASDRWFGNIIVRSNNNTIRVGNDDLYPLSDGTMNKDMDRIHDEYGNWQCDTPNNVSCASFDNTPSNNDNTLTNNYSGDAIGNLTNNNAPSWTLNNLTSDTVMITFASALMSNTLTNDGQHLDAHLPCFDLHLNTGSIKDIIGRLVTVPTHRDVEYTGDVLDDDGTTSSCGNTRAACIKGIDQDNITNKKCKMYDANTGIPDVSAVKCGLICTSLSHQIDEFKYTNDTINVRSARENHSNFYSSINAIIIDTASFRKCIIPVHYLIRCNNHEHADIIIVRQRHTTNLLYLMMMYNRNYNTCNVYINYSDIENISLDNTKLELEWDNCTLYHNTHDNVRVTYSNEKDIVYDNIQIKLWRTCNTDRLSTRMTVVKLRTETIGNATACEIGNDSYCWTQCIQLSVWVTTTNRRGVSHIRICMVLLSVRYEALCGNKCSLWE